MRFNTRQCCGSDDCKDSRICILETGLSDEDCKITGQFIGNEKEFNARQVEYGCWDSGQQDNYDSEWYYDHMGYACTAHDDTMYCRCNVRHEINQNQSISINPSIPHVTPPPPPQCSSNPMCKPAVPLHIVTPPKHVGSNNLVGHSNHVLSLGEYCGQRRNTMWKTCYLDVGMWNMNTEIVWTNTLIWDMTVLQSIHTCTAVVMWVQSSVKNGDLLKIIA